MRIQIDRVNGNYIAEAPCTTHDLEQLKALLTDYANETGSTKAMYIVKDWENTVSSFKKFIPISMITVGEESFAQK